MRKTTYLIFTVSCIWLIGCATQGRLTLLTFNKSESFETLDSSIEKLKSQYDGSLQEQISAVRVMRFISKHNLDPGKREMAIRALTFFAFTSDDGDIRDRSISRLEVVLKSKEWPTHLKHTVIVSIIDLLTGNLGFEEKHDGMNMYFGVSSVLREDALRFLLGQFDSLTPEVQYFAVTGLRQLLLTEPTLENCPKNLCDEDVRKNQEEWDNGREVKNIIPANADPSAVEAGAYGPATKMVPLEERKDWNEAMDELKEIIWDWIGDPLENQRTDLLIQGRLVRLSGEIENFFLQENIENDFREQTKKWTESEDISMDLRQLLSASREKVKLYGFPASKSPKPAEGKYEGIINGPLNFLETHLDAILREQHSRQKSGFAIGKPDTIGLAFTKFEESDTGLIKREIMLENVTNILKNGLLVDTNNLFDKDEYNSTIVEKAIDRIRFQTELIPLMKMIGALFPSLKAQKQNPRYLFEILVAKTSDAENLFQRRLFLNTLIAGAKIFPNEANLNLNIVAAEEYDVVTRHNIDSEIEKVQETF